MASTSADRTSQENIATGQVVTVPTLVAGANLSVTSSPAGSLKFDFDPTDTSPVRDGNDLVFESTSGGSVTVSGFFEVGDNALPTLTLPDGTEVDATSFFDGSGIDMTTAAGPTASSPDSGGTEYSDSAGDLLGGLDRLGMLGNSQWDRAGGVATEETSDDLVIGTLAGIEGPTDPGGIVTPPVTPPAPGEELKAGLMWTFWDDPEIRKKTIEEGMTNNFQVLLYDNNDNIINDTNNPFAGHTVSGFVPNDIVITVDLGHSSGAESFAAKPSAESTDDDYGVFITENLFQLLVDGKITVSANGVTYDQYSSREDCCYIPLTGEVSITLLEDKFQASSDSGRLVFSVHGYDDKVNEYDSEKIYKYEHSAADESFGIKVTGVNGKDNLIVYGKEDITGIITDHAQGRLGMTGGAFDEGSNTWGFSLDLKYLDSADYSTNRPNAAGDGFIYNSKPTLPGEDTVMNIKISEGANMQQGAEFTTSAYQLFLSMNKLVNGDAGVPSEADYNTGNYTAGVNWIIVSEKSGSWTAADNDAVTYELKVPLEYWDTHQDGKIDFDIQGGTYSGVGAAGGNFVVEVVKPDDVDMKGEIIDVTGNKAYAGDLILGTDAEDTLTGGTGDDLIYGKGGDDTLFGGDGKDILHGGDGDDTLSGDFGSDTLYGGLGDDILNGGEGHDILYGGLGNDTMIGGAGNDTFVWEAGDVGAYKDIITNFDFNHDKLSLDKLLFDVSSPALGVSSNKNEFIFTDTNGKGMDVKFLSNNELELTLQDSKQVIDVHLSGNTWTANDFDTGLSVDEAQNILNALITSTMGG